MCEQGTGTGTVPTTGTYVGSGKKKKLSFLIWKNITCLKREGIVNTASGQKLIFFIFPFSAYFLLLSFFPHWYRIFTVHRLHSRLVFSSIVALSHPTPPPPPRHQRKKRRWNRISSVAGIGIKCIFFLRHSRFKLRLPCKAGPAVAFLLAFLVLLYFITLPTGGATSARSTPPLQEFSSGTVFSGRERVAFSPKEIELSTELPSGCPPFREFLL
jgi:hypothetical protein